MKITENQNEVLRDEMGEYEGNGWRPSKKQFVANTTFLDIPSEVVEFWYDSNYQGGNAPDYMLDDY